MALRYVEIVLPCSECDTVQAWVEELEVVDLWHGRIDDQRMTVCAVVEAGQTEPLLDAFERRMGALDGFRAIVQLVEATIPRPPEPEKKPPEEKPAPKQKVGSVSREELLASLAPGMRVTPIYLVTILLSAIVAAVGLVRGNVAVIIGAMVIAPLLTPNMALALATTLGDIDHARKAFRTLVIGGLVALGFAVLVGLVLKVDPSIPEIHSRTSPHLSDFVVALASGAAGALAFTTGMSASLVGVMVAVALLPPLVVVGLLLGGGHYALSIEAATLFAINVICVNLAAVLTFLWRGVRPLQWWEKDKARRHTRRAMLLWACLLLALIALVLRSQR